MFKGDVRGEFYHTKGSECLEHTDGVGGGREVSHFSA